MFIAHRYGIQTERAVSCPRNRLVRLEQSRRRVDLLLPHVNRRFGNEQQTVLELVECPKTITLLIVYAINKKEVGCDYRLSNASRQVACGSAVEAEGRVCHASRPRTAGRVRTSSLRNGADRPKRR